MPRVAQTALLPLVLAIAVLVCAAPARPGDGPAGETLDRLSQAFAGSDAGRLRECLARQSRVYLAVPPVHRDEGLFGPDQVYYLFRTFFAGHPTRSFRLSADGSGNGRRSLFARADWVYEERDGPPRSEPLLFTLAEEDDRWVVTEIRSARP